MIGYWLERAVSLGRDLGDVWGPAVNSILASTLAAGAAVAAAAGGDPSGALRRRVDTGARAPFVLFERAPGNRDCAPSLVFFGANYAGFATRPSGCSSSRTSSASAAGGGELHSALLRVDPRLEEAARGLGKSPRRAFATVTTPLVTPGLLAAPRLSSSRR